MKQHDGAYGGFFFAVTDQLEDQKGEVPQLFERFLPYA